MAQEVGIPEKRNIHVLTYVRGEGSTIDDDIANDNQLITDGTPDETILNHDDLLVETGNAQGPWTLYQVKTDDNGKFFKKEILSGDGDDIKNLESFINGLKDLLDDNYEEGVISNYIHSGLQEESPPKKQRRGDSLGGRKSKKNRKSARKSKKNRKSKKSRK